MAATLAPGRESIQNDEYFALATARTVADRDAAASDLDGAIGTHNALTITGLSLAGGGLAAAIVGLIVWIGASSPDVPPGTVIE